MHFGILWQKLLQKMDWEKILHTDQHGSQQGHSAHVLPFVEEIFYNQA